MTVQTTAAVMRPVTFGRCAHCGQPKPGSWIVLLCRRCTRRGVGGHR